MPVKQATILDVARRAKVSVVTASKVMNHDASVRPYLRQRVRDAASRLNYQPNLMARAMKAGSLALVTFSVTDIDNPYFGSFANHLHQDLTIAGYHAVIVQHNKDMEAVSRGFCAAGSIMMIASADHVNAVAAAIPVVTIQGLQPTLQMAPDIGIDLTDAYQQLAEVLIGMGRRHITWYCPPVADHNNRPSKFGPVEQVLRSHDLTAVEVPVQLQGEPSRFAAALAQRNPEVDCVICHNDVEAARVMIALERAGLSCPDDVLVVGCDGTFPVDGMATLKIDIPAMARGAVDLLLKRIAGGEVPQRSIHPVRIQLPTTGSPKPRRLPRSS